MSEGFAGFDRSLVGFLRELEANNDREWFAENKRRYEEEVLEPALGFIAAMGPRIKAISRHFAAVPKRTGGSLMRVYRDTRFSSDKRPYKTNVGIQFRHVKGKDVHAPGFYVHIEPGQFFLGAGIWHPERDALGRIREAIDRRAKEWLAARDDAGFKAHFTLGGEALKRPPRGYEGDHPLIDDLKRTDFIAVCELGEKAALAPDVVSKVGESFAASRPFVRFLCRALDVPF